MQNKAKNFAKYKMPDSNSDSEISSDDDEEELSLDMESQSTIKTKGPLVAAGAKK